MYRAAEGPIPNLPKLIMIPQNESAKKTTPKSSGLSNLVRDTMRMPAETDPIAFQANTERKRDRRSAVETICPFFLLIGLMYHVLNRNGGVTGRRLPLALLRYLRHFCLTILREHLVRRAFEDSKYFFLANSITVFWLYHVLICCIHSTGLWGCPHNPNTPTCCLPTFH